ncbi:DUF3298 and DUF4163 domain-containing protein [Aureibacter tunicatorum]|uniref:DUF3298 domain-containing protein n=1 Tax=Aureibacter tunicatorum TaxID=866807 RepID=A0AAE3XKA5_9BACT|nr:DUF3298 domain-containing protein [Aureibacter tunicatorum]MDR6239361.1 hypothetical protein [Aureibacter tunicatorum]BDD04716.1 hypothetical protein AUTU_21990 [Aureibacter tunicatorum]
MKTRRFLALPILTFLLAITFTNCKKNQSSDKTSQNDIITSKGLSYEIISLNKSHGCENGNKDKSGCVEISISYPKIVNAKDDQVKNKLNAYIENHFEINGYQSLDSAMNDFIDNYLDILKFDSTYKTHWYGEYVERIIYQSDEILSLAYEANSYEGGAHSQFELHFSNLSLQTGNLVKLEEVLKDGYSQKLNEIGESIFRKDKNLAPEESLFKAGYLFPGNKFTLNNNYSLSDSGIYFFYNNYEIASYAQGTTELLIPIDSISTLIQKNWTK